MLQNWKDCTLTQYFANMIFKEVFLMLFFQKDAFFKKFNKDIYSYFD